MKKNNGITLIALVITIIILIILAAVSISILMGEDGLITKAKQGALNYQNAALEEQAMLNNFYGDFATEIASATGDLSTLTHIDNGKAATSDKILKDYQAYVNGELVTGTMENIRMLSVNTIGSSGNMITDITPGYYDKVTVNQTAAYNAGYAAGEAAGLEATPTLSWTLVSASSATEGNNLHSSYGSYTWTHTLNAGTYMFSYSERTQGSYSTPTITGVTNLTARASVSYGSDGYTNPSKNIIYTFDIPNDNTTVTITGSGAVRSAQLGIILKVI